MAIHPILSFWEEKRRRDALAESQGTRLPAPLEIYPSLVRALDDALQRRKLSSFQSTVELNDFLLSAARNMAVLAVRDSDWKWIKYGLLALIAEGATSDGRITVAYLSLLDNSAKKIGHDLSRISEELLEAASSQTAELIMSFNRRTDAEKAIDNFLFKEVMRKDGFDYKRETWKSAHKER